MFDEPKMKSVFFLAGVDCTRTNCWEPQADVYKIEDGWLVKFELAGVRLDDVRISLGDSHLTVEGARRDWIVHETTSCHSLEITYNRFRRTIHLPDLAADADFEAEYRDGFLLIWIQHDDEE